jgi:hypothetical protein
VKRSAGCIQPTSLFDGSPCTQPPPRVGGLLDNVDAIKDTSSDDEGDRDREGNCAARYQTALAALPAPPPAPRKQADAHSDMHEHEAQPPVNGRMGQQASTRDGGSGGARIPQVLAVRQPPESQQDSEPEPEEGVAGFRGSTRGGRLRGALLPLSLLLYVCF